MFEPQVFVINENHLKLVSRLWFNHQEDYEFGAPGVDQKRPYGNSDVYGDIAEILGIEKTDLDEEWNQNQLDFMDNIHKELATVLNIATRVGYFKTGTYTADAYSNDWEHVE